DALGKDRAVLVLVAPDDESAVGAQQVGGAGVAVPTRRHLRRALVVGGLLVVLAFLRLVPHVQHVVARHRDHAVVTPLLRVVSGSRDDLGDEYPCWCQLDSIWASLALQNDPAVPCQDVNGLSPSDLHPRQGRYRGLIRFPLSLGVPWFICKHRG